LVNSAFSGGLGVLAETIIDAREVIVRDRIVGCESDRASVFISGLGKIMGALKYRTQLEVRSRESIIQTNRFTKQGFDTSGIGILQLKGLGKEERAEIAVGVGLPVRLEIRSHGWKFRFRLIEHLTQKYVRLFDIRRELDRMKKSGESVREVLSLQVKTAQLEIVSLLVWFELNRFLKLGGGGFSVARLGVEVGERVDRGDVGWPKLRRLRGSGIGGFSPVQFQIRLRQRQPDVRIARIHLRRGRELHFRRREIVAVQRFEAGAQSVIVRTGGEKEKSQEDGHRLLRSASARVATGSPGLRASRRCMVARARSG